MKFQSSSNVVSQRLRRRAGPLRPCSASLGTHAKGRGAEGPGGCHRQLTRRGVGRTSDAAYLGDVAQDGPNERRHGVPLRAEICRANPPTTMRLANPSRLIQAGGSPQHGRQFHWTRTRS